VSAPDSVLSDEAPPVDIEAAAGILQTVFGLNGELVPLPSERDHNFRVRAAQGDYVLKIAHPGEPRSVTNFQTLALRHIAAVDLTLAVPTVVAARNGGFETEFLIGGLARVVRLLTYLPGCLSIQAPRSAAQDNDMGAFLARLGRALRGFFHPAAGANDILWDLRRLSQVRRFLPEIADTARRELATTAIAQAEAYALPILPALRAQVVHNDMNPSNVVVNEDRPDIVAGMLDFGDMLHGPLICDVAVACSYRWADGEAPLVGVARFVAGYHAVAPLEEAELAILLDLIRARLALTVTLVNWQAARFPEKRSYVMRLNAELWKFLEALSSVTRAEAEQTLSAAVVKAAR
jgi:Ser/Thr protein kinase RdoA (MazF antagonist)